MSPIKQLHAEFLRAEEELNLFDLKVRDVPAWEWIRFQVFHEVLLVAKGVHEPPRVALRRSPLQYAGILIRSLLDVRHNPYRSPPAEVLFVGHPRRKQRQDGKWWDLYCDPILDSIPLDALCLEFLHGNRHREVRCRASQ